MNGLTFVTGTLYRTVSIFVPTGKDLMLAGVQGQVFAIDIEWCARLHWNKFQVAENKLA